MNVYTIDELMHLTREEICDIAEHLDRKLIDLDAESLARTYALISLDNIRRVMLRRGLHF